MPLCRCRNFDCVLACYRLQIFCSAHNSCCGDDAHVAPGPTPRCTLCAQVMLRDPLVPGPADEPLKTAAAKPPGCLDEAVAKASGAEGGGAGGNGEQPTQVKEVIKVRGREVLYGPAALVRTGAGLRMTWLSVCLERVGRHTRLVDHTSVRLEVGSASCIEVLRDMRNGIDNRPSRGAHPGAI